MAGLGIAYAAALVWLYASVLARLARRRPIPPLLVLAVIGITVRTTVAVASGSSFFYFAQPVANSLVMTGVFLISIVVGRPLIEKLALEFWPLTPELLALPSVSRLLRGLTYLWAGVNLAIGATTLTLLVCLPLATYVAVKQVASLAITGAGIAITIDRSLRVARQRGLRRHLRRRPAARRARRGRRGGLRSDCRQVAAGHLESSPQVEPAASKTIG